MKMNGIVITEGVCSIELTNGCSSSICYSLSMGILIFVTEMVILCEIISRRLEKEKLKFICLPLCK